MVSGASLRLLGVVWRVEMTEGCPSFLVLPSPGLISKQHSRRTQSVSAAVRYALPSVPQSATNSSKTRPTNSRAVA